MLGTEVDLAPGDLPAAVEGRLETLDGAGDVGRRLRAGEQEHEVALAGARDGVVVAQVAAQASGDELLQLIGDGVAERVVDVLEAVDAERHDGEDRVLALRRADLAPQAVVDASPRRRAGRRR